MDPIISDVRKARPAGKQENEMVNYTVIQRCGSPWYGYGIKHNQIVELTKKRLPGKRNRFH